MRLSRGFATALLILSATLAASAAAKVTAKEFITERPTLISLGFEWKIDGDDNHNAAVAVSYRKRGDSAWKPGLPWPSYAARDISFPTKPC